MTHHTLLLIALAQVTPPYPRVQEEGVTLTRAEVLNFVGAGATCERISAGSVKCTITSGGGGSPGGSSGNLQTNNGSGGFGAYAGSTCASGVATSTNANGAWTCTSTPSFTSLSVSGAISAGSLSTSGAISAGDLSATSLSVSGGATVNGSFKAGTYKSPFTADVTNFLFQGVSGGDGSSNWVFKSSVASSGPIMQWQNSTGAVGQVNVNGSLSLASGTFTISNTGATVAPSFTGTHTGVSMSTVQGNLSAGTGLPAIRFGNVSTLNSTDKIWSAYQNAGYSTEVAHLLANGQLSLTGGISVSNGVGTAAQVLKGSSTPAWGSILLDELGNPAGNKTFTMANKTLIWNYTAPTGGDGAFEIEATGGFTGDLMHVHQHTGNPGAGTDLLHLEATDADVTALRVSHSSVSNQAIVATGAVSISGAVTINGALTLSTPLGGSSGGGGATLPTCSGTDKLTSNGTSWSCAADQTGGTDLSGASYWTKVAEANLSNEIALGTLGTGLIINTTTTGVPTIYAGSSCTNQFARSTNASGALTCAGVGVNDFTANQGTTTQVLHGNAAGQPSWGAIVAADLPTITVAKGGSNLTTVASNQVYVGTGTDTFTAKTLPSCSNATTSKLLYDNATQAFSCGTDQTAAGSGTLIRLTGSDWTNSTTTPSNILTTSLATNTEYGFTCEITGQGTATSLPRYNINGPSANNVTFQTARHTSTSAQTLLVLQTFSGSAQTANCTSSCNTTNLPTRISGTFTTTASGTFALMGCSSTSGQTVTVRRGSYCIIY